jgi:hypothetical protein
MKTAGESWAWWLPPVIPALMKLKQEDHKFIRASLPHIVGPCLKKKKAAEGIICLLRQKRKQRVREAARKCQSRNSIQICL